MLLKDLCNLLKSADNVEEIDAKKDEILALIPLVGIMFDYDQNNSAHQFDLWFHSLHTVVGLPRNLDDDMLYLAALLHDIGKPDCRCKGKREDDTNAHFYGHPEHSFELVRDQVIPFWKKDGIGLEKEEEELLLYYVLYHDDRVSLKIKHLRRHLQMVSLEQFKHLMMLEVADAEAHVLIPIVLERIRICSTWTGEYAEEIQKKIEKGI